MAFGEPAGLFASGRRAPSAYRQETVHLRDDDGLIEEVKSLSGTDTRLLGDEEVLRMVLPAIRADYRAAETYVPEPGERLRCPVLAMVGTEDPKVTVAEAAAWAEHTEGPFDLRVFSPGHFYLVRDHAEPPPTAAATKEEQTNRRQQKEAGTTRQQSPTRDPPHPQNQRKVR